MLSITSAALIRCFYQPKGHFCQKHNSLSAKDKFIYAIPGKLMYLDIITGIALLVIGFLAFRNLRLYLELYYLNGNKTPYFFGFGAVQLAIGSLLKMTDCFFPTSHIIPIDVNSKSCPLVRYSEANASSRPNAI